MAFTNSCIKTFRACPRRYYYKYELGMIVKYYETPAFLRIGTAIHLALENYLPEEDYSSGENAVEEYYIQLMAECQDYELKTILSYEIVYVMAIYKAYTMKWEHHPLITEQTEVQLSYQGFFIKCDGIGTMPEDAWQNQRTVNIEHKTVSKAIDQIKYQNNLILDLQTSIYLDIMNKNGANAFTSLYDIIVKPDFKIKDITELDEDGISIIIDEVTGERLKNVNGSWKTTPNSTKGWKAVSRKETHAEHYKRVLSEVSFDDFMRIEITRTPEQLSDARIEVLDTIMDIYGCQDRKSWPRHTENCFNFFGSNCPYYHLCCANMTEFNVAPEGFELVANPHVELDVDKDGNLIQETIK